MSDWQVEWEQPGPITLARVAEWKREAERLLAETMEGPYSVIVTLCDHILAPPPAVRVTPQMLDAAEAAYRASIVPGGGHLVHLEHAIKAALAVSFPIQQDADDIGQQEKGAEK